MVPALVLAAGLGSRLDPITRLLAKAAVPLGDKSLIERVLAYLAREGVTDVVINLHHRPESITGIVGDGSGLGLGVRFSWEREILGSAGGPRHALSLIDAETFLIVNGDTLCEIDLSQFLDAHEHSSAEVTLAVIPNPDPSHYSGIRAADDGTVRGFAPKGAAQGTWHFVGLQVVDAGVFRSLPDGVPAESMSGVYRGLVAADPARVCVYPVAAPFVDVGTPRDYFKAARGLTSGLVDQPASDNVVWPGVQIAADARLRACIVTTDAPAGLMAEGAIILPADSLRPGDRATRYGNVAVFPIDGLP